MSSSFRFFHAADLHLDSPLRGLDRYEGAPVEAIRDACRRAFINLCEAATLERVAFVVLAGDVFDGEWRDFGTGLFFSQQLRRLGDAGIRVYLLAGNHDAAANMTRHLRLPDNVFQFATAKPQSIVDASTGAVLHGQGFATRAVEVDLAASYPEAVRDAFNIGVLHTALEGRAGHGTYAPCTVATLRSKGYSYWALGHVHAREVVCDDPWIVFPGNLQGRHVRESGAKGASLITVEDGRVTAVEHCHFDVLRFTQLDVDVALAKSFDAVLDATQCAIERQYDSADGRPLAARVHVVGRSAAHAALRRDRDRLVEECRNLASALGTIWIEDVRVKTAPIVDSEGRDLIEALGLGDQALRDDVLAVARSDFDGLLRELRALGDSGALDDVALRDLLGEASDLAVHKLLDAASAHKSEVDT